MAKVFAEEEKGKMFRTTESCSVCLESVNDSGERSIAKLKCGHHFHLDCIGSTFNVKGAMQCPNCRHVEDGQWLYANGSRWTDDLSIDNNEEDYEEFPPMRNVMELDAFGHWICPFTNNMPIDGNAGPQVLFSLGDVDRPNAFSQGVMLRIGSFSESDVPICPYLAAQIVEDPRLPSAAPNGTSMRQHSNAVGTSSNGVGSSMGGGSGGIMIRAGGSSGVWGQIRHDSPMNGNSVYTYGGGTGDTASGLAAADRSNRHTPDIDLNLMPPRGGGSNGTGIYPDVGSLSSWHERHERPRAWTRSENDRPGMLSSHGAAGLMGNPDHGSYNGPHLDGSSSAGGPCPRPPPYMSGQLGSSQLQQPHNSAFRNAAIGSRRPSRSSSNSAASLMSNARTPPAAPDRRHFQAWNEFPQGQESSSSSFLGAAAETHGSNYHHGSNNSQGFVPWRRESSSSTLPSAAAVAGIFTPPDPVWQLNSRFSDSEPLYSNRHTNFADAHGPAIRAGDEHREYKREYNLFPGRSLYADYPTGSPSPYIGLRPPDVANNVAGGTLSHGVQTRLQR